MILNIYNNKTKNLFMKQKLLHFKRYMSVHLHLKLIILLGLLLGGQSYSQTTLNFTGGYTDIISYVSTANSANFTFSDGISYTLSANNGNANIYRAGNNALVYHSYNSFTYHSFGRTDGSEFKLSQLTFVDYGATWTFTGYRDGSPVSGAVETVTSVNYTTLATVNFDSDFENIDEVRFSTSTGTAPGFIEIRSLTYNNAASPCLNPTTPTVTTTQNNICLGSSTTLNISGALNDATEWRIYSGSCGGTLVGTTSGSSFVVNPTASSTTYYVRGESSGGCVVPGSCGSVTINVSNINTSGAKSDVSCFGGNNGAAAVSPSGGISPYSYSWSPSGGTGSVATGLAAGNYTVTITDNIGCQTTRDFTINQPSVLSANGVATNVSCNDGNNGAIDLTVVGGTSPYTYIWSNTATTEDLSGLEANTYSVTVTDANGCTATESVEVTEPAVLTASGVATNVSCNGGNDGALDLTVTGGTAPYTFAWNNTATTEDLSGLTAATYSVTVTDSKGCTATETVDVFEPIILEATGVATEATCAGNDGSINLTVIGGNPPYTYLWSNTATTEDLSGLTTGTYSVTVTDSKGCTATESVAVDESLAITANGVATNVSCNGGTNGTIDLTVSGGTAPYTFAWNNSAVTEDITGLAAGIYEVAITDNNGCTATESVEVTEPAVLSANSVATNVSCNGGNNGAIDLTVTGGTTPYTYAWSNTATTEDLSGLEAGTYDVTVTDVNGCTATSFVEVTEPTVLSVNGTDTNVSCNGGNNGAIDLTVSGGTAPYTYAWSNTATTEDLSGLEAGTYDVTVTDANGCTATESVEVTEPAVLSANSVVTNVSCNGGNNGTINLTVTGGTAPYTYAWSNTATTEDLSGLEAGTYDVTVTDANGCTATTSAAVTEPTILSVNGTETNVSCNGGNNGAIDLTVSGGTAPYTYSWSNTATTQDLSGLSAATYTVTVTDSKGCTATESISVTEPTSLSISSTIADAINNDGTIDLSIIGGTAPYSYSWSNSATTQDLSGLTPGTYSVTITDTNGCSISDSFIVEQACNLTTSTLTSNLSCNGGNNGTIDLTVTGGTAPYTYAWSNTATTEDLSGLEAGTYDVTVTDANGCTATTSVEVVRLQACSTIKESDIEHPLVSVIVTE